MTGLGLWHLSGLTALQHLNLFQCENLTDQDVEHIIGLTSLQDLNLSACMRLTEKSRVHLSGLIALRVLNLEGYYGLTKMGIEFRGLEVLRNLFLSGKLCVKGCYRRFSWRRREADQNTSIVS